MFIFGIRLEKRESLFWCAFFLLLDFDLNDDKRITVLKRKTDNNEQQEY